MDRRQRIAKQVADRAVYRGLWTEEYARAFLDALHLSPEERQAVRGRARRDYERRVGGRPQGGE